MRAFSVFVIAWGISVSVGIWYIPTSHPTTIANMIITGVGAFIVLSGFRMLAACKPLREAKPASRVPEPTPDDPEPLEGKSEGWPWSGV